MEQISIYYKKASEVIWMKENSYTELMKSNAMNKKKKDYVQNLYIEMLLTEALLKSRKRKIICPH